MVDRAFYKFIDKNSVRAKSPTLNNNFGFVDGDVNTSTDKITETNHGLQTGDKIVLTGSALPTGLFVLTDYFIIRDDDNTVLLATSKANAEAGTQVDITAASGGGAHTVVFQDKVRITLGRSDLDAVGDWIYLYHGDIADNNDLTFAGWYQFSYRTSATEGFINTHDYGGTIPSGGVDAYSMDDEDPELIPIHIGLDGNYGQVDKGSVLNEATIMERLANAINATMRVADTSIASTFVPWMTAGAGSEFDFGQLIIRQEKVESTTLKVTAPSSVSSFVVIANNTVQPGTDVTAVAQVTSLTTVADVSDSLDGKTFILQDLAGTVAFWIDTDDSGTTIPLAASNADRAVEITTIVTDDSAGTVATRVSQAIDGDSAFTTSVASSVVTITNAEVTDLLVGFDMDSGFTISTTTQGTSGGSDENASTRLFPSRVIISYPNFPELFDNPFGLETDSTSIIDVNSADGQQITGIIPFFGEAVFGAGQVEDIVVVFKENSIYLLNIKTRSLSKIQSRGLGCTAPFSIASSRDGIMFVNDSGIYKLNRDQSISYIGKAIERLYEDDVRSNSLANITGHHHGVGRQYQVSVPFGDDQTTNNVRFNYDYQAERGGEFGAWTRDTNFAATGWCNLSADSIFSTTDGQVFAIRRTGGASDYRDDAAAVDMEILLRATGFGQTGSRKIVNNIISHFQMRFTDMSGTTVSTSVDLDGAFTAADTFSLTKGATNKIESIRSSLPRRRLQYLQVKYTNSTLDEAVILSGLDYNVAVMPSGKSLKETND